MGANIWKYVKTEEFKVKTDMSNSVVKKLRRFWRRFQYIHPTKRHVILITACFWVSGITLWSVRQTGNGPPGHHIFIDDHFIVYDEHKDPFNTVIHKTIEQWHLNDNVQP